MIKYNPIKNLGKCAQKGNKLSEETKRKISQSMKKHIKTFEHRQHLGEALKGKKLSEETKEKISIINRGRTPWNKGKIGYSTNKKGKKFLQYSGKKHPFWGKHHSKTTKEKISKALKGNLPWNRGLKGIYKSSMKTRKKLSKAHKGEKSYSWKGGITPINHIIRNSLELKLWREAVYGRDNFTCQKCEDNKGGNLHSHHIENFATHPELRFEISNGITLCKSCHKELHNRYGYKNNTKEQLEEFLSPKILFNLGEKAYAI